MNGLQIEAINARKNLYRRIHALSEENLRSLVHYLDELESREDYEPNEETVAAIEESLHPENLIECSDIQDMFKKCGLKCSG